MSQGLIIGFIQNVYFPYAKTAYFINFDNTTTGDTYVMLIIECEQEIEEWLD